MAWTFRKTKKVGPLRFTLSKKGIGMSFGVKGARVGITPTGDLYRTVGRGGLYNKQILKGAKHQQMQHSPEPEELPREDLITAADDPKSETNQLPLPRDTFGAGVLIGVFATLIVVALVLAFVFR